jgi:hypothetical protein
MRASASSSALAWTKSASSATCARSASTRRIAAKAVFISPSSKMVPTFRTSM